MKILKLSFLFYTLLVCFGIAVYAVVPFSLALGTMIIGLLLLGISSFNWPISRYSFIYHFFLYVLVSFALGVVSHHYYDWKEKRLGRDVITNNYGKSAVVTLVLESKLKSTSYHRFVARLVSFDSHVVDQEVIVLQKRDSINSLPTIKVGDFIGMYNTIVEAPSRNREGGFDYRRYLLDQGIVGQVYLKAYYAIDQPIDFLTKIKVYRQKLIDYVSDLPYWNQQVKALFSATVLGDRSGIEEEVLTDFKRLGIMHVLAISGLHVGILFVILKALFFFLNKRLQYLVIVLFLWLFLFIAGFSPPVYRVVLMFTIYGIGVMLYRPVDSKHVVGLTLFISLLFEPLLLYSISFQFSYIAVLSILYVMPYFSRLYSRNIIIKYLQELVYVSIAVQFGLLPLQVYYFNSVSLGFILGNLLAIPFITVFLIFSIISFIGEFIWSITGMLTGPLLNGIVDLFFSVVKNTEFMDVFYIEGLVISPWSILSLFSVYIIFVYRSSFKFSTMILTLVILANLSLYFTLELEAELRKEQSLLIPHTFRYKDALIELRDKGKLVSFPVSQEIEAKGFVIPLKDNKNILLLTEEQSSYNVTFPVTTVVVFGKVAINYERMLEELLPDLLIIHASVPSWYRDLITSICVKKNIPFHDMREKGYYKVVL